MRRWWEKRAPRAQQLTVEATRLSDVLNRFTGGKGDPTQSTGPAGVPELFTQAPPTQAAPAAVKPAAQAANWQDDAKAVAPTQHHTPSAKPAKPAVAVAGEPSGGDDAWDDF